MRRRFPAAPGSMSTSSTCRAGRRDDFSPSWSPDGETIAYRQNPHRGDEGELLLVPVAGGEARNLTRSPAVADWSPAWHPSGETLAFCVDDRGPGLQPGEETRIFEPFYRKEHGGEAREAVSLGLGLA